MKKTKLLAIAILVIVLLAFAGCSNEKTGADEKKSDDKKTEQKKDKEKEKEKAKTVEIEFWYGLGSVAGETMEGIIQDFNAAQDRVKVTGVSQASYADTYKKLQAAIASNTAPAVYISGSLFEEASKGILAPLDGLIAKNKLDVDDYLEVFMEPAKIDGKYYAIPAYGTTQVIYYRKDVMEKAGLDPKEVFSSWENVYKASKKLVDENIVEYGHLPMWGPNNLNDIALSNGANFLSEDKKTVLINSEEFIEAWDFIRKQVHDEKVSKINSGGQGWEYWYRTIDDVMTGKAMSYTGSSGDKGDLDFNQLDSIPQPGLNGNPARPNAGALFMAVPAITSEEKQAAAFEWMSYFSSPEVSAKWSMKIGYIPVRKSSNDVAEYKKFIEENPYAGVPYQQALTASPTFEDPTGGDIIDALTIAADKVELENISAKEALDEAYKKAQKALDKVNE